MEIPALTQIRVLIASGRSASLKKAEGLLEVFLKVSEEYHLVNQIIEASVLKSLLLAKQEQVEKALEVLAEVISLAEPGHFIRPFIEAGPAMQGLLEKLLTRNDYPYYAKHLMSSMKKYHGSNDIHASTGQAPKYMIKKNSIEVDNESLSPRELEITNLLAEGWRNKEIASKLYVSEGTIKKHIYNMCQKWAVHNRIKLIQKARELGYLDA
jgi:LuxR family maltose regulon positive regulatory protein